MRHPFSDVSPLLLGNTAGNGNDHGRIFLFQFPQSAKHGKRLLFRLFTDAAGVHHNHISLGKRAGRGVGISDQLRHDLGITLVHLTTECFYV